MSYYLGQLAIAANVTTTQDAPTEGAQAVIIGNESGLTCIIGMQSGGVEKVLYPGTLDWFQIKSGFSGTIQIKTLTVLSNASSWPASDLLFTVIGPQDPETASQYPVNLNRSANIGNSIPLATSATSIANDGNAAATQILEATVSGDGSSAITATNDAKVQIGDATYGGYVQLYNGTAIQTQDTDATAHKVLYEDSSNEVTLAAAGSNTILIKDNAGTILLEISGNGIQFGAVPKLLSEAGGSVLDVSGNTDMILNAPNAGGNKHMYFEIGGVKVGHFDTSGNFVIKGSLTQNGTP